jgi:hypothetical protein
MERTADLPTRSSRFLRMDIVEDEIPDEFDLILIRHLMIHLRPDENLRILSKLSRLGEKRTGEKRSRYVMMTTHLRADENEDEFMFVYGHEINLFKRPYHIRDPLRLYRDGKEDMYIGLWDISDGMPPLIGSDER